MRWVFCRFLTDRRDIACNVKHDEVIELQLYFEYHGFLTMILIDGLGGGGGGVLGLDEVYILRYVL